MRLRTTLAATAATIALAAGAIVATTTTATADETTNPTFISGLSQPPSFAAANALQTDNPPINVLGTTPFLACGDGQSDNSQVASVNAGTLAKVKAVAAHCDLDSEAGTASAVTALAGVSLFNGAVTVGAIEARCTYANNTVTVGATIASLFSKNNYTKNGSGGIVIPGLAAITVNQKFLGIFGGGGATALTVDTVPIMLGTITLVPAQHLAIGSCGLFVGLHGQG